MSANSSTGRTLVLCFDGTSNQFDTTNTNIIRIFDLLKKDDPDKQLVYYQPGIGTYQQPGMWMPLVIALSKLADQAFAWFLDSHIMGGYKFLMQNWREGDRICLFGFSRGAYTARCLAGMLHKVGLIPSSNQEQVPFAYNMYKKNTKEGWEQSAAFAKTFSRQVTIEFVGCFETVSSVGVLFPRHLPFSSANTIIKTFRHALALDEHRARFQPNQWHRVTKDNTAAKDPEHASYGNRDEMSARGYDTSLYCTTDVEEVWFSGCHSDVGGGAVPNTTPHSLAFLSLRWMVEQTIRTQTGILWNPGALKSVGITATPFAEARFNTIDKYCKPNRSNVRADSDGQIEVARQAGCPVKEWQEGRQVEDAEESHNKSEVKTAEHQQLKPPTQHEVRPSHDSEATYVPDTTASPQGTAHPLFHHKKTSSFKLRLKRHRDATNQVVVAGETVEERIQHDAMSPVNDELKRKPLWWILEILPEINSYQDSDGRWKRKVWIHLGRGRKIVSTEQPLVHVSVKERMASKLNYQPRAKLPKGYENAKWVE